MLNQWAQVKNSLKAFVIYNSFIYKVVCYL